MDFAFLPPEINSGRMYTGPGAAPMLARRSGLGRLVSRIEFGGSVLRVGSRRTDWRAVAGAVVAIDGGCRPPAMCSG